MEINIDKIIRKELLDSGFYSSETCEMSLSDIKALKDYANDQVLKEQTNLIGHSNPKIDVEKMEKFAYVAKEMSEFLYEYSEKFYSKVLSKRYPINKLKSK